MASKDTSGKNDVINLTDKSYKRKKFTVATAGIYRLKITPKSKIRSGPSGNYLELHLAVTKGEYAKKVSLFDTVSPTVDWKVAQLLAALGIKKFTLTLAQLLKMVIGKELRASLRVENYNGRDKNKVVQFLPLKSDATDDAAPDDDDDESAAEEDELDETTDDAETTDDDENDDAPASSDDDDDDDATSDDDDQTDDDDDADPATDDDDDAPADDDDDDAEAKAEAERKARLKKKQAAKKAAEKIAAEKAAAKRGGGRKTAGRR